MPAGRPLGSKNKPKVVAVVEEKAAKPRGRPPGSKNKPKVVAVVEEKVVKKRGRPPGSKNKPKVEVVEVVEEKYDDVPLSLATIVEQSPELEAAINDEAFWYAKIKTKGLTPVERRKNFANYGRASALVHNLTVHGTVKSPKVKPRAAGARGPNGRLITSKGKERKGPRPRGINGRLLNKDGTERKFVNY